jgi:exopolysaccharide biosynthesis polyprenyl glycosylphosphotransferase
VNDDRHRFLLSLLKLFDLSLVLFAFGLTTVLIIRTENRITLAQFLSLRIKISNGAIFLLLLFLCHLVFCAGGLYRSRRLSTKFAEIPDILKATTMLVVCFLIGSALFRIKMITIPFLSLFWVVMAMVLCSGRLLMRYWLAYIRSHGENLRYMLILGTNSRAVDFARRITANSERGYRLIGFVDDDWQGMAEFKRSGFPLVTDYAGLAEFLRRNVIDEVAIYLPFGSYYAHSSQVASLCQQHGIIMRFNSDIFGLKTTKSQAEEFDGEHYITTCGVFHEGWPLIVKRSLDIAISLILLLLLAPTLLTVALLIKLTSSGPIFFRQERVGLNKRRFKILKFRTMVPGAEKMMTELKEKNEVSGPVFKMKHDPRITPIGKFLRRSSIDELPQLLNVLKGDMSLVGPRPLPVRDYEGFNEDWQRRRFSVKPGITCLWQVNGRSGISFDQWMLLDLQYMDEWSIWLDLKILAKTVPAVLRGTGAA